MTPASAHTPHACPPPGLLDAPGLSRHIEHADILSGRLSFQEVAAHGEALFTARFNKCDGQGRPQTESTGENGGQATLRLVARGNRAAVNPPASPA